MEKNRPENWKKWMNEQKEKRREEYNKTPERAISDYNTNQEKIEDYSGRELFELIQNAEDAMHTLSEDDEKKLEIKLIENNLYIANTGEKFSKEGVKSLMLHHNSPKEFSKTELIGYKGLGFRSIIDWTNDIIIYSGGLKIHFDRRYVEKDLVEGENWDKFKNHSKIKEKKKKIGRYPIPILSFPKWIDNKKELSLDPKGQKTLEDLIEEYDTVICLSLRDDVKREVARKIEKLDKESLLFLKNLKELKLEIEEDSKDNYRRDWVKDYLKNDNEEKRVILQDGLGKEKIWDIKVEQYDIKDYEMDDELQRDKNKFEVQIALPVKKSYKIKNLEKNNNLYSYFPTEISFPFPILVHANLDLTGNRNDIVENSINAHILKEIAKKMADVAEEYTTEKNPWLALSLITPGKQKNIGQKIDKVLKGETNFASFNELLTEKTKDKKIIPTKGPDDSFLRPNSNDLYILPGQYDEILPQEVFKNAALDIKPSVNHFFKKFQIDEVKPIKIKKELNKINKELNIEKRGGLIYKLYKNNLLKDYCVPKLLIDQDEKLIDVEDSPFLPPEEEEFEMMGWTSISILNSKFTKKLKEKFNLNERSSLTEYLNAWDVKRYEFREIVRAIVNDHEKRIDDINDYDKKLEKTNELIKQLSKLYFSGERSDIFKKGVKSPKLPTSQKDFIEADKIYLNDFFDEGLFLEELYREVEDVSFLKRIDFEGIEKRVDEIKDFLCWLGVNNSPILKKSDYDFSSNEDYFKFVFRNVDFPIRLDSGSKIDDFSDFKDQQKVRIEDVYNFDKLDEVLNRADPNEIICWLAFLESKSNKVNLDEIKNSNKDSKVIFKPPKKQSYRNMDDDEYPKNGVPSYAWYLLTKKIQWIPIENQDGKKDKVKPSECVLKTNLPSNLQDVFPSPSINYDYEHFDKFDIDNIRIQTVLRKLGVGQNLKNIDWDSIYSLLLKYPEIDPEGKNARNLYRSIIENKQIDDKIKSRSEKRTEFIRKGKLFAKKDGSGDYYPVDDIYYAERKFNEKIMEKAKILDLGEKKGVKQVKDIFGVEKFVDNSKVHSFSVRDDQNEFDDFMKSIIPYIYALRIRKAEKGERKKLENIEISLCDELKIKRQEDEIITFDKDGRFKKDSNENDEYYLLWSSKEIFGEHQRKLDEVLGGYIGEIISDLLGVKEIKEPIARLLTCSPDSRKQLLKQIKGEDAERDLKDAKEELKKEEELKLDNYKRIAYDVFNVPDEKINLDDEINKDIETIKENINEYVQEKYNREINWKKLRRPEDLSADKNYDFIKEVCDIKDIPLERLNEFLKEDISYYEKYKDEIKQAKKNMLLEKNLKPILFKMMNDEDIEEKRKFEEKIKEYKNLEKELDGKDLHFDPEKKVEDWLSENIGQIDEVPEIDQDTKEIRKENVNKFRNRLINLLETKDDLPTEKYEEMEEYLNKKGEFWSLMTFEENWESFKLLKNQFECLRSVTEKDWKETNRIEGKKNGKKSTPLSSTEKEQKEKKKNVNFSGNTISYNPKRPYEKIGGEISELINEKNISITKSTVTESDKKTGGGGGGAPRKSEDISDEKKELFGFIGELVVFRTLSNKYEDVQWISKNAERAGYGKGNDSLGYDIKYKKGNKEYLVEVKTGPKKSPIKFDLSRNEYKTSKGKGDQYKIFYVPRKTDSIQIFNLENIIEQGEDLYEYDGITFKFRSSEYQFEIINVEN